MIRSKLRKKILKSRSECDKKAYTKQKNKFVSLLKENQKGILFKAERKRRFFSDKSNNFENISLIENGNLHR